MSPQDTALPPTIALFQLQNATTRCNGPMCPPGDVTLARLLFTVWAVRTGRMLRPVSVTDLSPDELTDFWADDQLEH